MKYVVLVFVLFVYATNLFAVNYTAEFTNIGNSGVANGRMVLSKDGKYLFVCNRKGHFTKFNLNNRAIEDTLLLPSSQQFNLNNFFSVESTNQYLLYSVDVANHQPYYRSTLLIYDLKSKTLKKSIALGAILSDHNYSSGMSAITNAQDSVFLIATNDHLYEGIGYDHYQGGRIFTFNPFADTIFLNSKSPNKYDNGKGIGISSLINSNKNYVFYSGRYSHVDYSSPGSPEIKDYIVLVSSNDSLLYKKEFSAEFSSYNNIRESVYLQTGNKDLWEYSLEKDTVLNKRTKREFNYSKLNFFRNDMYYSAYNPGSNKILIFENEFHTAADTIAFEQPICDAVTFKDSNFIYVSLENGDLFKVEHPLISNERFVNFGVNTDIFQTLDTVKLEDFSIGNYDRREWTINGTFQLDTGKLLNFIPSENGFYDVELTLYKDSLKSSRLKSKLFYVYNRLNADYDFTIDDLGDSIGVQFTDKSVGDITAHKWFFCDYQGNTSTKINPYHKYPKGRIFSTQLIISNENFADTLFKDQLMTLGRASIMEITEVTTRNKSLYKTSAYDFNRECGLKGYKINDSKFGFISHRIEVIPGHGDRGSDLKTCIYNDKGDFLSANAVAGNYITISDSVSIVNNLMNINYSPATADFLTPEIGYFTYNINTFKSSGVYYYHNLLKKDFNDFSYFKNSIFKEAGGQLGLFIEYKLKSQPHITKNRIFKMSDDLFVLDSIDLDIESTAIFSSSDNKNFFILTKGNESTKVNQFSFANGLQYLYPLPISENIVYYDYNPKHKLFLYAYQKVKGNDTIFEFAIVNRSGIIINIVETLRLNSIKFTDDFILVAPFGHKAFNHVYRDPAYYTFGDTKLILYDLNGRKINTYFDDSVNGEIIDIFQLTKNRAYLFGNKGSGGYLTPYQSGELGFFYVVDLEKIPTDTIKPHEPVDSCEIYPNPTTYYSILAFPNSQNSLAKITVYDFLGKIIDSQSTYNNNFQLLTYKYATGSYTVVVEVSSKHYSSRLVVVR